ncbi:ATP-binding protein [Aquincola sp. J276]|uniref:ATP-binding protein n=1 Tax=Aquincola sp. J276 TaxID=2898432 RepID=UPI00215173B6|nr:ATP-binding protein [Aquincola sp. J276]MCR5868162.1 response regulator [Aquincola sp. J276]
MIRLRQAARQLGSGDVPPAFKTGVVEADDVAAALHTAAVQAQASTAELQLRVAQAVADARQIQAQLLESQKHEAIGRLTGGLAHDFNNLLQTITTSLQLALRAVPQDGPQHRALQAGVRATGKAAGLIRQMTAFGPTAAFSPEPIRVEDWLLRSEELLTKALAGKATLAAAVDTSLPALFVDAGQLELATMNLVFNARDAMPQGGTVRIEARRARTEEVRGLAAGEYLCLAIVDSGHGMTSEVLAQATDPYFSTKPSPTARGMGLSQVQAFARQSGGALVLESQEGQGTRAKLILPAQENRPASSLTGAAPKATSSEGIDLKPLRVLMVEDDALAASVVVPALQAAGHDVQLCETADRAVQVLEEDEHFDVLFTDVVMPGQMNGIQLVRWAQVHRPELPAVVATGYTEEKVDPALVVLHKPYEVASLLATLHSVTDRTRSTPAA